MQSVEVKKQGLSVEYKVTVPASELKDRVNVKLKEYTKKARISGFRPGKAPMNVIEQRYGDAALGEVVEKAVNDGTNQTIRDNKLRPATQPKVDIKSFEKDKDLEFTVSMDLLPEVKVMDVKKLKLERPVAKVADSAIEDALNRIAKNNRSSEKVERAAKKGDIVVIDYAGKLEDGTSKPGMSSVGYSLELGSNSFIPGFEDQLIGTKAGDDKVVKVNFPDQYHAEDLSGKGAEFAVSVHEVREPKAAELNDDFAKKLGTEDLNALKKAI
ncbi:MAG TPA: trigger factor, partial [Alphaproteobacteria bacterium]